MVSRRLVLVRLTAQVSSQTVVTLKRVISVFTLRAMSLASAGVQHQYFTTLNSSKAFSTSILKISPLLLLLLLKATCIIEI